MKKVLLVSNVITQIIKFNSRNIDLLKELGYEVHVACNIYDYLSCPKEATDNFINVLRESGITIHHIDFGRRIKGQLLFMKPYKQLLKLLRETKFEFIHCHSMIAGLLEARVEKRRHIVFIHMALLSLRLVIAQRLFCISENKILTSVY